MPQRKTVDIRYDGITSGDNESKLVCLTTYQINALLGVSRYLRMLPRYIDLENSESNWSLVNDFTNDIEYQLVSGLNMNCCDVVADCIENSDIVKNSLNLYFNIGWINPTTTLLPEKFSNEDRGEVIVAPDGCDFAELWGICFEIATRMDAAGRDLLETIVSNADTVERVGILINSIPFIGNVASSVVLALVENIQDIYNGYLAYSSASVIEGIACALFEANCADCDAPTYDSVLTYYSSAGITGIQDFASITLTAFIDYLTGSSGLANQVIYYTTASFVLFNLYLGGRVLNLRGHQSVALWAQLGKDSPGTDYLLLCAPCSLNWQWDSSFTTDQNIFLPINYGSGDNAVWTNGIGWQSVDGINPRSRCIIINATFTATTINTVTMTYNYTKGTPNVSTLSAINITAYEPDDTTHVQNLNFSATSDGTGLTMTLNLGGMSIDEIGFLVRSSVDLTSPYTYGGSVALTSISITGSGTNPFI